MGGRFHSSTHDSAISKINAVVKHANEIRNHLEEVIKGTAFKGTQRSQAFLRHVVARSLVGDATYNVWRFYMAGSARTFAAGRLGVVQMLLAKRMADGQAHVPLTREDIYARA